MSSKVIHGDNIAELKKMPDNSVDSIVTDAPYGLGKEPNAAEMLKAWIDCGYLEVKGGGFMGQKWDAFVPQPVFWKEVFRVLKPGGYVLCFFGTRTYDWGVMAIRLGGFEIREMCAWLHGQGFPKSHNISLAIEKMQDTQDSDVEKWDGFGTALKPAIEPIVLARKPIEKGLTIAENILKWGTGAINIDGCRIEGEPWKWGTQSDIKGGKFNTNKPSNGNIHAKNVESDPKGRFPSNLIHDGSDEVVNLFPNTKSGTMSGEQGGFGNSDLVFGSNSKIPEAVSYGDSGSASRFFYVAKPSQTERNWGLKDYTPVLKKNSTMRDIENVDWKEVSGNHHSTLKPVSLMRYLVRMITPPGGTCLDPFNGSGTTGIACKLESLDLIDTVGIALKNYDINYIGIEMDEEFCEISRKRIESWVDELEPMVENKQRQNKDESQTNLFT